MVDRYGSSNYPPPYNELQMEDSYGLINYPPYNEGQDLPSCDVPVGGETSQFRENNPPGVVDEAQRQEALRRQRIYGQTYRDRQRARLLSLEQIKTDLQEENKSLRNEEERMKKKWQSIRNKYKVLKSEVANLKQINKSNEERLTDMQVDLQSGVDANCDNSRERREKQLEEKVEDLRKQLDEKNKILDAINILSTPENVVGKK